MNLKALPGRNDPCPCGSGKKYKKCCLGEEQGRMSGRDPVEWFYAEGLPLIVDRYAALLGDEFPDDLDDDWGYVLQPGDIEAMDLCRKTYMVLGWTGWRATAGVSKSRGRTIAEDVVREFPALIDREMREWLGRVARTTWSFYVVASNPRGGPCEVEDLMTGEHSRLSDVEVASGLDEGTVFFAAMLPREGAGESRLFNLYPWIFGGDVLEYVRQLRERIAGGRGFLTPRQLDGAQDTLRLSYFVLHLRSDGGELQNYDLRDGEEVVRVVRRYALSTSPLLVFDALEDLARPFMDRDELLEQARLNEKGRLEYVLVPWCRVDRSSGDEHDFRIAATFHIGPGVLTVHTVSERLARNAYKMVRRRLGDGASLVETERSEPEGRFMSPEFDEGDDLSPTLLHVLADRPLHPLALTFHAMTAELPGEGTADECFKDVLQALSERSPGGTPGGDQTFAAFEIALSAAGWSQGVDGHLLLRTVERAAATPSPEAAWLLRAIGSTPGYGLLGEKARALAERLARGGIEPSPLARAAVTEAFVSAVDGAGCRALVARTRESEPESSSPREVTLDSVFHLRHDSGFDVALIVEPGSLDLIDRMRADQRRVVACSTTMARELVADALSRVQAAGTRVPSTYLFAVALLHEEPIEARTRTPDLGAYDALLGDPRAEETARRSTSKLVDSELFGSFWPHDDELYKKLSKRGLAQGLMKGEEPPASLVYDVIENSLEPRRAEVAHGLACNLEFAAMEGRHGEPLSLAAFLAWCSLAETRRPLRHVPYASILALRAIYNIAGNLSQGVRSVAEAEQSW